MDFKTSMLIKTATGFCFSMLMASTLWAQCNAGCGTCNDCQQAGVYQDVVGGGGDRGNDSDWDNDFYNCYKKTRFDFDICDPCCGKPYVSLFGGATTVEDFYREVITAPTTVEQQGVNYLDDYMFGGAIGYRVHQLLRLEAEYSYRYNRAESFFTATEVDGLRTAYADVAATGRVYSHAGMFNALYDFSQRRIGCPNLYGGGGIGVLTIDADVTAAGTNYVSNDSQFAYQFIAGVNLPTSQRMEWFGEYRFLGSEDLDLVDATAGVPFGDVDYHNHSLVFGLRINR